MLFPKQYLTLAERGLARGPDCGAAVDVIFPVVYLQRHCLELVVKDLIWACFHITDLQVLAGETPSSVDPPEREHKFHKLLPMLKEALVRVGYGEPPELVPLAALAKRFEKLERGSPERLRYASVIPFRDGKAPPHSFDTAVDIPVYDLQEALRQVHRDCVDIENDDSLLRQLFDESEALIQRAFSLGTLRLESDDPE